MRCPHSRQESATAGPRSTASAVESGVCRVGRTAVMARPFLIFPAGAGRMWHLLSTASLTALCRHENWIIDSGCRGFVGPYPSAPLDEWVIQLSGHRSVRDSCDKAAARLTKTARETLSVPHVGMPA